MQKILFFLSTCFILKVCSAQQSSFLKKLNISDSVKAIQYYQELSFKHKSTNQLVLKERHFAFAFKLKKAKMVIRFFNPDNEDKVVTLAKGLNVDDRGNNFVFRYPLKDTATFKILTTLIVDSASNTTYYTGYVFLPAEQKWKLMGSYKCKESQHYIDEITFLRKGKHNIVAETNNEAWLQRENNSWKNISGSALQRPLIDVTRNIDSAATYKAEINLLNQALAAQQIDATGFVEGVYYKIIKQGTGEKVQITDTVSVLYKGWLFNDGSVFDQTKEKPASFPLKRLIKGWQLGLPQCNIGGIIRLYIPSALAYSIRARSKSIPPNSILVFDVEVVAAKHGE